MQVRTYIALVVLACALGGLFVAGFIVTRHDASEARVRLLDQAREFRHQSERMSDALKQLFLFTDLLFGSSETYTIDASRAQARTVLALCRETFAMGGDAPAVARALKRTHRGIEELLREISAIERNAQQPTFVSSHAQLARVDQVTAGIVDAMHIVEQQAEQRLERLQDELSTQRSEFDLSVWTVASVYLVGLVALLLWASASVSRPLAALAEAAQDALASHRGFEPDSNGPVEVRALANHIRKLVESLEEEINRTNTLIDAIPDTLIVAHRRKGIEYVKPGLETPASLAGLKLRERDVGALFGDSQIAKFRNEIIACLAQQEPRQFELVLDTGHQRRSYELRATARNSDQALIIARDLTEKVEAESRIRHMAFHDGLTGLLNREAFMTRVHEQITSSQARFALLFIDIDRFKSINDVHGHKTGDRMLRRIADSLKGTLGKSGFHDSTGIAARIGGDEFMIMLTQLDDGSRATEFADQLLNAIAAPQPNGNLQAAGTASIGISLFPEHGREVDELMNHADLAMFDAKRTGGNTSRVYEQSMGEINQRKLSLEAKLRRAVERGDLFVVYQPKVELRTGRIVGAEALVRWQDGDKIRSPLEFVPIAEECGLIVPIGDFVLTHATRALARWKEIGLDVGHIAVNFATQQLRHESIERRIINAVEHAGLSYNALNIEVTESVLIDDYDHSVRTLRTLHDMGFRIAMDDFGTGYSSLSYLQRLPIDILKIDRAFVSGMEDNEKQQAIARAIVDLGQAFGLVLVAEGVETEQQAATLERLGCNEAQGYLYSPPLTGDAFAEFCRSHRLAGDASPAELAATSATSTGSSASRILRPPQFH